MDAIRQIIAQRAAAGLSLKAYGVEGYTADKPFTCHARDAAQLERYRSRLTAVGFTVETLSKPEAPYLR